MFNLKNRKIYFFIALLLVINLFKNIYIENKIEQELIKYKLKKIAKISCRGVINIECHLNNLLFEENSTQTLYSVYVADAKLLNMNLFKSQEPFDSQVKLIVNRVQILDNRGIFETVKKPIDINVSFFTDKFHKVNFSLLNDDLAIKLMINLDKKSNLDNLKVLSASLKVERENSVIKKIIYELYKLKLLETKESDDEEFSATKGINLPLGKDSAEVIPQNIFFGEVYESVSILLLSELETLDVVMNNNEDNSISNFLEDIIKNDGETTLEISNNERILL